jgi:hypothetical protein
MAWHLGLIGVLHKTTIDNGYGYFWLVSWQGFRVFNCSDNIHPFRDMAKDDVFVI